MKGVMNVREKYFEVKTQRGNKFYIKVRIGRKYCYVTVYSPLTTGFRYWCKNLKIPKEDLEPYLKENKIPIPACDESAENRLGCFYAQYL